jgi:IS5 family transposase
MRRFVGIDLGCEPVPGETTMCRFRHLLKEHDLGRPLFDEMQQHSAAKGLKVGHGHDRDQAYRGQRAAIRESAPKARDFTNRRYRHRLGNAIDSDVLNRVKTSKLFLRQIRLLWKV